VQRVAIALHDFLRLLHFPGERWIVRTEPVIAVGCLDQEKPFSDARLQAADLFFRQDHAQRVSEFANLEFNHAAPSVITNGLSTLSIAFCNPRDIAENPIAPTLLQSDLQPPFITNHLCVPSQTSAPRCAKMKSRLPTDWPT
jgi:hypothetical protein